MTSSTRVLIIAEAVTLAHTGRCQALANGLHRRGVDVALAFGGVTTPPVASECPNHVLPGIGAAAFGAALRTGAPVLRREVLNRMVAADRELLAACKPDLVIGDFRLSLSVSARLAGIPYATLSNAYWSPECALPLELPVLPLSRVLPVPIAAALFNLGRRVVLPLHCRPMNQCRVDHGLPALGHDLRRVYTDADHVLFADPPGFFPSGPVPANHHFLGPVLWSPDVARPPWWDSLDRTRPSVYVSMGSSGDPAVLDRLLRALSAMRLEVMASTAGQPVLDGKELPGLHLARYLPGDQCARQARLVICNGGSMGCQQAFMAGVPVLGVAGNMDQFLNMRGVEAAGAGLLMRADRVSEQAVRQHVGRLLEEPGFGQAAHTLRAAWQGMDPVQRLFDLLPALTAHPAEFGARQVVSGAA